MNTAVRSIASFALAFGLLGQAPPKDVDGWGKLKWGMTIAEARAAGLLEPVKIGDIAMKVDTFTKGDTDSIKRIQLYNFFSNQHDFDTLKTLLTQKYGASASQETKRDEINARITTVLWTFPSTSILLTLREGKTLYLDYTATDKKALDKL
jgi:hypothetical protein